MRFATHPRTEPPPIFTAEIVAVFREYEGEISTDRRPKGLTSDQVLEVLLPDPKALGFEVERGKRGGQKVARSVAFPAFASETPISLAGFSLAADRTHSPDLDRGPANRDRT